MSASAADVTGQNPVRVANLATDSLYVTVVAISIPMSISGIVPVTTQTSVSVSGLPVWFAPGALVAVSNATSVDVTTAGPGATATAMVVRVAGSDLISITASAVLGTVVTLLGTINVIEVSAIPNAAGYVYLSVTGGQSILSTMTVYTAIVNENYTTNITSGYTITRPILLQFMTVQISASSAANILTIVLFVTTSGVVVSTAGVTLYLTTLSAAANSPTSMLINFFTTWSSGLVLPAGGVLGIGLLRSAQAATNSILISTLQLWAQRM